MDYIIGYAFFVFVKFGNTITLVKWGFFYVRRYCIMNGIRKEKGVYKCLDM